MPDVLLEQGAEQQGRHGGQAEHDGDDGAAGDDFRQQPADGADDRVEGHAHRILEREGGFRHALGAGGDHVLLAQLVEQGAAHHPDDRRGAGHPDHDDRQRQMPEPVEQLGEAPRGVFELAGKQAAGADPEQGQEQVHQDQGEQEVGGRQADEPHHGEAVVAERVLVGGGVDADRDRHHIGEQQGDAGQQHGERQSLQQQHGHRPAVHERRPQVAGPAQVLQIGGQVQAVLLLHGGDLLAAEAGIGAARLHARQHHRHHVAGRELDHDEHHHRQGDEQDDHVGEAPEDVAYHGPGCRRRAAAGAPARCSQRPRRSVKPHRRPGTIAVGGADES